LIKFYVGFANISPLGRHLQYSVNPRSRAENRWRATEKLILRPHRRLQRTDAATDTVSGGVLQEVFSAELFSDIIERQI
jgi:hypothetical protein